MSRNVTLVVNDGAPWKSKLLTDDGVDLLKLMPVKRASVSVEAKGDVQLTLFLSSMNVRLPNDKVATKLRIGGQDRQITSFTTEDGETFNVKDILEGNPNEAT